MTPPRRPWTWCNRTGCETKLIFARRAGTTRVLPYEYDDRAPFTEGSAGCHVIVAGEAWSPLDLIEDFQARLGISEPKARELVTGYPWHRPHRCEQIDQTTTEDAA